MRLDFNLGKPIYLQILEEFKRGIARGDLLPGDKLPSQRELAQQIKVNPNTVQKAYQEMERSQLVETLRGQGTFVCSDTAVREQICAEMAKHALDTFLQEMAALGYRAAEIRALLERELPAGGEEQSDQAENGEVEPWQEKI